MIGILDTRISDNNLGNYIIMDAVYSYIDKMFGSEFIMLFPFLDDFGSKTMDYMKECRYIFMGGTNSLSSEMNIYKQIGLNNSNSKKLESKIILMGVGWWQYQGDVNGYTKSVLRKCLNAEYLHSVRDSYSLNKLSTVGIKNVVNTGCPTMWGLNKKHCAEIKKEKSSEKGGNVLVCFTDYNRNYERDCLIMKCLVKNYSRIYTWVQGPSDFDYIKCLNERVIIIPPRIDALYDFLDNTDVDYVGTRLHAGIACLQRKKKTIIVGIDNRAEEMKKDFFLPVISQDEIKDKLDEMINSPIEYRIEIPENEIRMWIKQFGDE